MSAATLVGIIAFCSLWTCGKSKFIFIPRSNRNFLVLFILKLVKYSVLIQLRSDFQMPNVNHCNRSVFRRKPPSMKKDMAKQHNTGLHLRIHGKAGSFGWFQPLVSTAETSQAYRLHTDSRNQRPMSYSVIVLTLYSTLNCILLK